MSQIAEQKCPACGAPLRFDPASGKLVCDYCGTVTELAAPEKPDAKYRVARMTAPIVMENDQVRKVGAVMLEEDLEDE